MKSSPFSTVELGPIAVVAVVATRHSFSSEFRYSSQPDPRLGALVRMLVMHRDPNVDAARLAFRFNGLRPSGLLERGDWSWYEMPENLGIDGDEYELGPGCWAVYTFNTTHDGWGIGSQFDLEMTDQRNGGQAGATVAIAESPVRFCKVVCLAEDPRGIVPKTLIAHLSNDATDRLTIREFRVYPTDRVSDRKTVEFEAYPRCGQVGPGERTAVVAHSGPLPLARGLIEVVLETPDAGVYTGFANLRFKADRFDVGSGWLGTRLENGAEPLLQERFLKTLTRMHVNLFWGEDVPGYTDDTGPGSLYERYPLRQMAHFENVERYNADSWVRRIHGVDRLGEPQHIRMAPMEVYLALRPYREARYPTTLTLSEEKGWRNYAGLADFPHFDAYRVAAPSMDDWRAYECWDRPIDWGAPLEGIGVMTRSLREINEPVPVAMWSQCVHPGWRDQLARPRKSPTPDEILAQAYQGIANGVIGLYWYSLETWSLLKYRDCIDTITRIGREIRLLEDLYLHGVASFHERISGRERPSVDLNVVAAPDAAVLFILDLEYFPDHDSRVFRFGPSRTIRATFPLPRWLQSPADVFRVDADGVYDVEWKAETGGVCLRDRVNRVGIYVAAGIGERDRRRERLHRLVACEQKVGFDPAGSNADFALLVRDFGFDDESDLASL